MQRLAFLALLVPSIAVADRLPDPPPPPPASNAAADLENAIRAHDAKAVAKLLDAPFISHGVWFPDAGCTRRFGKPKEIKKGEIAAFASCLAKLDVQASTRRSTAFGATLLTYAPGIELELGFDLGLAYYAGHLHARGNRAMPTLTAQAFEALRTAGTTNLDTAVASKLDPVVARYGRVLAWLEVCVDAKGKTSTTVSVASDDATGAVFLAATRDWKFSAFTHDKKPVPVCSQSLVTYPSAKAPVVELLPAWEIPASPNAGPEGEIGGVIGGVEVGVEGGVEGGVVGGVVGAPPPPPPPPPPAPPQNVPPTVLETQRIAGDKVITPDPATVTEIQRSGKAKIIGSFKLCVTSSGDVMSVSMLKSTGFSAYDEKIQRAMRTWRYRPYQVNGKSVPVCTAVTFIYSQT